jgi:hypothetical protein
MPGVGVKRPGRHVVHDVDPAFPEYFPAVQAMQEEREVTEYVPLMQGWHAEAPPVPAKRPGWHARQEVAF